MLVGWYAELLFLSAIVIGLLARERGRRGVLWGGMTLFVANLPRFGSHGEAAMMTSAFLFAGALCLLYYLPKLKAAPEGGDRGDRGDGAIAPGVGPETNLSPASMSASAGFASPLSATPIRTVAGAAGGDIKECPFCAEVIKAAAIKCKHCGSDLTAKALSAQVQAQAGKNGDGQE